jgi:AraC-like DNA-binding protein
MPKLTTPAQYVLILIDLVEHKGIPREKLLAGTQLSGTNLNTLGARISDADFIAISANAVALTGDPGLGLELGMSLNLGAHATLGQAFMTCRDLGQVIELFLKYHHLLAPNLDLVQHETQQRHYLTLVALLSQGDEVFFHESLFGAIINTLRTLLNDTSLTMRVEAPYPAPPHSDRYRQIFGDDVHFDCLHAQVSFPVETSARQLPSANPALRALYEGECARLLADLEEDTPAAEQTLRLLRKLEGQYPQMPQTARMLSLSPRTYRRRLAEENHSYQALLDQVRAEHATRYLQNTRLPLSSIAYMLGFNDASNFRRAYLKWTGLSPGAVRRDK